MHTYIHTYKPKKTDAYTYNSTYILTYIYKSSNNQYKLKKVGIKNRIAYTKTPPVIL